ncbi:MAG TPA: adenosine kinase [Alphaproteobacteria bacterium]|nr:adenosine kinase [Rhodospirillaceae bacterium]HRJ12935.1 adenosine kinase [Alphaproteobacteria bacterium]
MDVVGIGNALVDVLSHADDATLDKLNLVKGTMHLVSQEQAENLYKGIGPATEMSGGSAANTIAGIASFGGRAAYIGKVANDQLGAVFSHDMKSQGITFNTQPHEGGIATGCCLVLVTPDGERTMNTFLGASNALAAHDIDANLIQSAQYIYLEGYLFDPPAAKEAFFAAAEMARNSRTRVALTLSDLFCVGRHRDDFERLIRTHVDVLFANEQELIAQYQAPDLQTAITAARGSADILAVTRSEKGAVIITKDETIEVAAQKVKKVVDTTGAGDLFASGFLYGLTQGMDLAECGRLGTVAAAEIISHLGARPQQQLARLAA